MNDDNKAWEAYWKAQDQPWRTEPEISQERQAYLTERRKIKPDPYPLEFIFPFKDIKLSRANVEWLLSTPEDKPSFIDWSDESQRECEGLDLRGADLRGVDLARLPLARINAGPNLYVDEGEGILPEMHLEGACLIDAHLEGANLKNAYLEKADLFGAHLEGADLRNTHFERANLDFAHLEGAFLTDAHFEEADLGNTHLEKANLSNTHVEGANLIGAFFDGETSLNGINLGDDKHGTASFCDIHWGDANLSVIDWSTIPILGDENKNIWYVYPEGDMIRYQNAARAYRQFSVALRNQGLSEDAARFTYRAQLMQRKVFWYQHKFGQYLFSGFLDLLSGYGYKPIRCFIAYLLVIFTFATTYYIIGHRVGPILSPLGSVVFSMTSFHGRGFFPGGISLDDPLTVVAALEAFIGLLIEVTFIATLTQRLFGK
jgi:uncharacterized protein YjbI with pentapeptide repeats